MIDTLHQKFLVWGRAIEHGMESRFPFPMVASTLPTLLNHVARLLLYSVCTFAAA